MRRVRGLVVVLSLIASVPSFPIIATGGGGPSPWRMPLRDNPAQRRVALDVDDSRLVHAPESAGGPEVPCGCSPV